MHRASSQRSRPVTWVTSPPAAVLVLLLLLSAACSSSGAELGPYRLEAYVWDEGRAEGMVEVELTASLDVGSIAPFLPGDVEEDLEGGWLPVEIRAQADVGTEVTRDGDTSVVALTFTGAEGKATTPFGERPIDEVFVREIGDGGTLVLRIDPSGVVEPDGEGLFTAFGFPGGEVWTGYDCPVLPDDGIDPGEIWEVERPLPLSENAEEAVVTSTYEQRVRGEDDVADVGSESAGRVTMVLSPEDVLQLLGTSFPLEGLELDTGGTLELSRACVLDVPRQRLRRSLSTGTFDATLDPAGEGLVGAVLGPMALRMDFTITFEPGEW